MHSNLRGSRQRALAVGVLTYAAFALTGCGGGSSGAGEGASGSPGASSANAPSAGASSTRTQSQLAISSGGGTTTPGGSATKLVFTGEPSNVVAGAFFSPQIQVSIEDSSNNVITSGAGSTATVVLAIGTNAGGGTLSATQLSVAAVNGVATFVNVSINKIGNGYTLKATSGTLTAAASVSFNVNPGTPTKLVINQQPTKVALNGLISPAITVEVEDSLGNPINSFSSTITASIASGPGNLHGTVAQATVGGIATFPNLSIDAVAHNDTLTFSSSLGGVPSVTSGAFDVGLNGVATKLVLTSASPTSVAATAAITPALQITVEDAFGVKVATATTSITVSILNNAGNGTLTGTTTVSALSGVATFSALHIDKVGNGYTLQATAAGLTAAQTGAFNIVNGAATHLAFSTQPTTALSTSALAPAVQVSVLDAGGNVVTASSASIAVAIGTNAGGGTLSGNAPVAASSGVATFSNLSIDKAGNGYTLKATSGTLTAATSAAFDIQVGPPTRLAITKQPASAAQNALIAPAITVAVEDSGGNTVVSPGESITVAIANNPSSGTLFGTLTQATINGVATFNNLSIDTVGLGYTLSFTSSNGSVTSIVSAPFNCGLVGVAAKLAFTVPPPATATSQVSLAPAVQVTIEDAFNTRVSSTATVTISFGANPNGGTLGGTLSVAAVGGIATFSAVKVDRVGGGYELKATAAGLASATSSTFTVNAGVPTHMAFTTEPTGTLAGQAIGPFVVTLLDAGGNVATGSNASVTVAIGTNPGAGTLSGTKTVAASSGVANFSTVSINKIGTGYTLTASATGITGATSSAFNITLGPASQLKVTVQPASTAPLALVTPSVQVTVEDAGGNTVASPAEQITVAIGNNPSGGTLAGTLTQATTNGVATFNNLSIDQIGKNYTLTFTSATGGVSGVTSNPLNIGLIGVAYQLGFTVQPANVNAAQAIAPAVQVTVEDAFGTKVSSTATITIAIGNNAGAGTLTGTLSAAAVGGVANFGALHIDKMGIGYTLKATAAGLVAGTSAPFNVNAGPATKLAFTAQPSNAVAATAISPGIFVTLLDAGGNVAANSTASVTLSIGTNPASGTLSGTLTQGTVASVTSFNDISINAAGTGYTLKAASGTLTAATSTAFNITKGTAAKLGVTVQPSNAGPNAVIALAIQVAIQDAGGNTLASQSDNITVTIANNPANSTLAGTLTQATFNGVAAFPNLSLDQLALGYTLKFHANTLAITDAVSAPFGIGHAGIQDHLAFTTLPANTPATKPIAPQVTVEDIFGTKVSVADSITVAIANNPAGGTLSGTKIVTSSAGVAAFTTLSIDKVGTGYTLSATAPILTGCTSAAFNIVPGTPTKLTITSEPLSTTASYTLLPPITVQLVDAGGNFTTGTNTVTMAIGTNPGGGTLSGTLSVAAVNGVATFSGLSINKVGNGYTLVASSTGLTGTTSTPFNISVGVGTQLVFSKQPPASATAGVGFQVQVTAQDERGNVVPSFSDPIVLGVPNSSQNLTATPVNGVATFSNVTVTKAGANQTLFASDQSGETFIEVISSTFKVVPAAAKSLLFTTQPLVAKPGAVLPPIAVSLVDSFGNVETTGTNTVAVALGTNTGGSTLGGTKSVACVNGVATFSTLTLNRVGNGYTLTASAAGLEAIGSTPFNISNPGTPAKVVFKTQPTNITAGHIFSPVLQVAVEDSTGAVTSVSGTVFLDSLFTQSGAVTLTGTTSAQMNGGIATFNGVGASGGSGRLQAFLDFFPGAQTISIPSNSISVLASTPTQMQFQQSAFQLNAVLPNQVLPPISVQVQDASFNICTSATNTVTISLQSPNGATLAGTLAQKPVNGIVTWSNLSVNKPGTYSLQVTSPGLTNPFSSFLPTFTVGNAGVAAQVVVLPLQLPIVSVGQTLPTLHVAVQDVFGNTITTANDQISIGLTTASQQGPGTPVALNGTTTATASNGVATFSGLSPGAAGFLQLVPTDGTLTQSSAFLSVDAPVTQVTPASGSTAGGTSVTVTGNGFGPGVGVSFGNFGASNVAVVSSTQLTCTTPAFFGTTGPVNVAVGAANGPGQLVNGFTYLQPGNWQERDTGISGAFVQSLGVSTIASSVLIAGTGVGTYASTDAGNHWEVIPNAGSGNGGAVAISPVTSMIFFASGSQVDRTSGGSSISTWQINSSNAGPTTANVVAILLDPLNPSIIYCATDGEGIFKSIDSGANFFAINTGLSDLTINSLAIDPANGNVLYAGSQAGGVFVSNNGGATWAPSNTGLTTPSIARASLLVNPQTPATLYAGTNGGGVFKSINSGASWSPINNGLTALTISGMAFEPNTPSTIYAATNGGGVFTTTNGGTSWTGSANGLATPFAAFVAPDPVTPGDFYVGDDQVGIYKSTDTGSTFFATNNGLKNLYAGGGGLGVFGGRVAFDPQTPTTAYVACYGAGLFKSTNTGASWTRLTGVNQYVSGILVDPTTPTTLYTTTYFQGPLQSTDGGATWNTINTGLTQLNLYAIAIAPSAPTTLYAGSSLQFAITTNAGAAWTPATAIGLPLGQEITSIVVDPNDATHVYVSFLGAGVYQSSDSGATFTSANNGLFNTNVNQITLTTNGTMFAATNGNLFISNNAGVSWTDVPALDSFSVTSVAVAPNYSNAIYAGVSFGSVYESFDGGATWAQTNLSGNAFVGVYSLAIDPTVASNVFAGTAGAGLFMSTSTTPPPSIGNVSPLTQGAGNNVTITGNNLQQAIVTFGGGPPATIVSNDGSTLVVTVPSGSSSGTISLTTLSGGTTSGGFTLIPAPVITAFATAQSIGGQVTITGTNLSSATAVTFGGGPSGTISNNTAVSLTATVPSGSQSGSVSVTTPGGTATLAGFSLAAVTNYDIPTASAAPHGIAIGPDGSVWFPESAANKIARITPNGVVTEFAIPTGSSNPTSIVQGSDGNLWFTEQNANQIGQITLAGVITEFPIPTANAGPVAITAGPDFNLWFVEVAANNVAQITLAGAVTEFPIPTSSSGPTSITSGPDGNLWFTEDSANQIGQCTTQGVITEFLCTTPGSQPVWICSGSDGNLWFTEQAGNQIGQCTTSGVIAEFPIPTASCSPYQIAPAPDGNLWFCETATSNVGRITTAGVVTEILTPGCYGITAGPDASLWFTANTTNNTIGRLAVLPVAGTFTEIPAQTAASKPFGIALGADGTLWATEVIGNNIIQVFPTQTTVEFPIPTANAHPAVITPGPDGNLYFTELAGNNIGQMTTTGTITEFPVPTAASQPFGITAGPDGNLWFTESAGNNVGMMTPAGVFTEFPCPTPNAALSRITAGPDGNLWFTEQGANKVGRITTAGVITEFATTAGSSPSGIVAGPDGNLWFTEPGRNKIARITTAGAITEFSVPAVFDITQGPDGNLWFTESNNGTAAVGRMTTSGAVTIFQPTTNASQPSCITVGPDGNLWFTEQSANNIANVSP